MAGGLEWSTYHPRHPVGPNGRAPRGGLCSWSWNPFVKSVSWLKTAGAQLAGGKIFLSRKCRFLCIFVAKKAVRRCKTWGFENLARGLNSPTTSQLARCLLSIKFPCKTGQNVSASDMGAIRLFLAPYFWSVGAAWCVHAWIRPWNVRISVNP